MMKKYFALIISIALLLLCGCSGTELRSYEPTEAPDFSETTGTPESAEPDGETAEEEQNYDAAFGAYAADELVMTVNGLDVTWAEYFFWMASVLNSIEGYTGKITNWDDVCLFDSAQSNSGYVKGYALDSILQYRALEYNAAKAGITLSDEDRASLEERWQSDIETYGGGDEAALMEYFESIYIVRDIYDYMNEVALLYQSFFTEIYGENGEHCTDEQARGFADDRGYVAAKHILVKTVDDEGAALPEQEIAEKLALAEDFLAQLEAADDKDAKFDELMNEFSDDTGLAYYPDGYIFSSGEMAAEFEEAAFALEVGQISDITETSYGYHIILRIPLNPDGVIEYVSEDEQYSLRYAAATNLFSATIDNWIEEARDTVVWAGDFESLDLAALFA